MANPTATADNRFDTVLAAAGLAPLARRTTRTLQVNLGRLCNQTCRHCHVDAGPARTEQMDGRVAARVLQVLRASPGITTLDITGGAPELNPHFRPLVDGAVAAGREVLVRCNLTVLGLPSQADTPEYFAARGLVVIASLPCYTRENVDAQRGVGVFASSIAALRRLNALGYGHCEGGNAPVGPGAARALRLHLVYNPLGPSLPGDQAALEADYRRRLAADHGLVFDRLFTLANLPIHRFADDLRAQGRLASYEDLLAGRFNPAAAAEVMCRTLVSVDWEGRLADCDFHQVTRVPLGHGARTIFELDDLSALDRAPIATATHCLGCTAGQGSSCAGALADAAGAAARDVSPG